MLGRPIRSVFLLVALTVISGCVDTTKVGLSNARTNDNRNEREDKSRDVIANGEDSCNVQGSRRRDPAPLRLIACPGDETSVHRVATRD